MHIKVNHRPVELRTLKKSPGKFQRSFTHCTFKVRRLHKDCSKLKRKKNYVLKLKVVLDTKWTKTE